jgi:hypothetical protein
VHGRVAHPANRTWVERSGLSRSTFSINVLGGFFGRAYPRDATLLVGFPQQIFCPPRIQSKLLSRSSLALKLREPRQPRPLRRACRDTDTRDSDHHLPPPANGRRRAPRELVQSQGKHRRERGLGDQKDRVAISMASPLSPLQFELGARN